MSSGSVIGLAPQHGRWQSPLICCLLGLPFYHAPMDKQLRTIPPEALRPPSPPTPDSDSLSTETEIESTPICAICQGAGFFCFDVQPDHPKFGMLHPCPCTERTRAERLRVQLTRDSNLGFLDTLTFDTFNPQLGAAQLGYAKAIQYVSQPLPEWMLFDGPCGSGKTHLAAAIGHAFLEQMIAVRFMVVPDLLDRFYPTDDDTLFARQYEDLLLIRNTAVLILDSLGMERQTTWGRNTLAQLLNYRYQARLLTVITLNAPLGDLAPAVRVLLADTQICHQVHMNTPDVRPLGPRQRASNQS
jgi:DNA replication protein DnaC